MSSLPHLFAALVLAPLLVTGCASAPDGDGDTNEDTNAEALSAATCSGGASGVVGAKQRALLDTIAFTEGTAGTCHTDGYGTGFGLHCFSSCAKHPNKTWSGGGYTSTAAGRYQFLSKTWSALGYASFSPRNQDLGAARLVSNRGVTVPSNRAMTATEFSNAMRKLSLEWASLPYSPYGQPTRSLSATRAKYCTLAGC
jgi:lysozyme